MLQTDPAVVRDRLVAALGVRRWADDVVRGGPYGSVAELVAAADAAGAALTDAELDEGVAHHALLAGEDADSAARLSPAEQAGLDAAEDGVDAGLVRGDAVYEARFGRVFLTRTAGRSEEELLEELQRRLKLDAAEEAAEAKEELRRVAGSRLRALFAD